MTCARGASTGAPAGPRAARGALVAVGVLAAANVLNNRVAPRLAPATSVAAAGTLVAVARRCGLSWGEMGFRDLRAGVRVGGALAGAVAGVYGAGVLLPPARRFFRDERALGLSRARLIEEILVQVPLGTVLLEEVAFRGVLPALLDGSYGRLSAVAGSSALFGLWHVLPALDMAAANPALTGLASRAGAEPPMAGGAEDRRADRPLPAPHANGGAADGRAGRRATEGPVTGGVGRVVVGTVVATGLAGMFFHELRRRGGLAAPALLHLATNSLGFVAARAARRLDRRTAGRGQAVGTTWKASA